VKENKQNLLLLRFYEFNKKVVYDHLITTRDSEI